MSETSPSPPPLLLLHLPHTPTHPSETVTGGVSRIVESRGKARGDSLDRVLPSRQYVRPLYVCLMCAHALVTCTCVCVCVCVCTLNLESWLVVCRLNPPTLPPVIPSCSSPLRSGRLVPSASLSHAGHKYRVVRRPPCSCFLINEASFPSSSEGRKSERDRERERGKERDWGSTLTTS